MATFSNIVAVVQNKEDAAVVLQRAAALSTSDTQVAAVHAVRVVYEAVADLPSHYVDVAHSLKTYVLEAEASALQDDIDSVSGSSGHVDRAVVWNRRTWEGILHAAEEADGDLIIKRASAAGLPASLRTPDDWNLLRHASVPVLLTHAQSSLNVPVVLAAIDTMDLEHRDLNSRVLATAAAYVQRTGGALHIVSAYPALQALATQGETRKSCEYLEHQIVDDMRAEVVRLTSEVGLSDRSWTFHSVQGELASNVQSTIDEVSAQTLVLGTKARTGVVGALLGNTSEKLLAAVQADVLTVP